MYVNKIFFSSLIFTSIWAFAFTDGEIENKVRESLNDRHPTTNEQFYLGLGDNAPPVLIKMYQTSTNTYHRIRLIEGLENFKSNEAVTEFLQSELKNNAQSAERRSLARNLILQCGDKCIGDVEPLLADADSQMRLVVAQTLKELGTTRAQQLLQKYESTEHEKWIIERVHSQQTSVAPLRIMATSEQNADKKFDGLWAGVLVESEKNGLKTVKAEIQIKVENGKVSNIILSSSSSKVKKLGMIVEKNQGDSRVGKILTANEKNFETQGFVLSLNEEARPVQIVLRIDTKGVTFIGQKKE